MGRRLPDLCFLVVALALLAGLGVGVLVSQAAVVAACFLGMAVILAWFLLRRRERKPCCKKRPWDGPTVPRLMDPPSDEE